MRRIEAEVQIEALKAGAEASDAAAAALSVRKTHALALFSGLGRHYDVVGALLSFGQDPRWRRALVAPSARGATTRSSTSRPAPGWSPASSCAATAARVVGLDQSEQMLAARARAARARSRLASRIELVRGEAERLPFADGEFDRADLHLPAALRRRPGGDAARAGARRAARRDDRHAGVRRARPWPLRAPLDAVHARRAAGARARWSPASGTRSAASSGRASPASTPQLSAAAPRSRCGGRRASARSGVRRMSFGAGVVMWGGAMPMSAPDARAAGLLRAAPGPLARSRHAPAPALHRVAPQLRRAGRGGGADRPRRPARRRAGRVLPRGRRRPRTRSTSCTAARWARGLSDRALVALAVGGAGRRGRHRHRRARSPSRYADPVRRRRSFIASPTTWSCSAGASTPTPGSRSRGAAFPALTSYWVNALSFAPGRARRRRLHRAERRSAAAEHAGARAAPPHRVGQRRQRLADGRTVELTSTRLAAPLDGALAALSAVARAPGGRRAARRL